MYSCIMNVHIGISPMTYAYAGVDGNGAIVEDAWDHGLAAVAGHPDDSVSLQVAGQDVFDFDARDKNCISLLVSDARIAISCPSYQVYTATTFRGMELANTLNKAAQSYMPGSQGLALAGQIRYEWLATVGYKKKAGLFSSDEMVFSYTDDDARQWVLEFSFAKKTDVEQIANMIAQKASRFRLAMTDQKAPDMVSFLQAYAGGARIPAGPPKEVTTLGFPNPYPAPTGEQFRPAPGR